MADIDFFFNAYKKRVGEYEAQVAGVGDVAAGDAIEDTVDRCGKLSKKLDKDKKTLENELRLIRDPEAKNGWKEKIDSLGSRLAQAKSALETKREQAELFRGVSDDGGGGGASGGNVTHVGPTNDEYLDRAEQVHDQIDGSLQNMAGMTDEMEELGDAIAEQLDAQTQQIASIHTVVLNMEDGLKRSDALMRTIAKRMATDKVIQMFFLLNVLAFIGIVVYVALGESLGEETDDQAGGGQSVPGDDDLAANAEETAGDAKDKAARRLLRGVLLRPR